MSAEMLRDIASRPFATRRVLDVVKNLRLVLPVAIFLVVVGHQAWETMMYDGWTPAIRFAEGVLFYGLVGPLVTFWTLDWIAHAIETREAIEAANEDLKQLDALKDEFVSLVSHELRAPLTNINASVELLLLGAQNDRTRAKLEIIGQEASRLTRLVQGVLDVSRMEAGRLELLTAPVDPAQICQAALVQLGETDHPCAIDIAPGTPAVLADAERAAQVLGNLLSNATKYSPSGSRVEVAVRPLPEGASAAARPLREGLVSGERGPSEDPEVGDSPQPEAAMVLFSVADHGVGIPPDEVGRVFERFYRVERGDARETYGHGLGLYIARKIVEAHGGRIWAESRPGAGATFLFTLPAAPEEP